MSSTDTYWTTYDAALEDAAAGTTTAELVLTVFEGADEAVARAAGAVDEGGPRPRSRSGPFVGVVTSWSVW